MFWRNARSKYAGIDSSDPDIAKYLSVMEAIQDEGYGGIAGFVQDLGHKYVSERTASGKTLEIGFGLGRQGRFFKGELTQYYPTEINMKYTKGEQWNKFSNVTIADATNLPFEDCFFDQVVSIYNLEHIEHVEFVLQEVKRVLKEQGTFVVALPCEDGLMWNLGREFTTRRVFNKKYGINYDKAIAFEHVHNLQFLQDVLGKHFSKIDHCYFPFFFPSINMNLIYCAEYSNIPLP